MGSTKETEKTTKKANHRIFSIAVENQAGRIAHIRQPRASDILGKFPNGEFDDSEYSLIVCGGIFRKEDHFIIEWVRYGGLCALSKEYIIENLRFEEYVTRGRKEFINIESTRRIT